MTETVRRRFPIPRTLEERWLLRVDKQLDGCWIWRGARWERYGKFYTADSRRVAAHRWGYEHFVAPIPAGLELDHLCRNIWCVNPSHLEPVTHLVNVRRGRAGAVNGARQRAVTHCPAGHIYNERNTYLRPDGGRTCRPCQAAAKRRKKVIAA